MKKLFLFTAIFSAILSGCADRSPETTSDPKNQQAMQQQAKETIEELLKVYQGVLNTSNTDKAVSLYTRNGVFMPSEAPSAIGKERIKEAYEFVFSHIQLNIEFNIEEIVVEHNMAYAFTTSKGTTLIHASGETVPEVNRELFILEKENGDWKIARYMFNKMEPKS